MSLEAPFRQLSFAVQGLRLYPRDSPVVRAALGRTHTSLYPLLQASELRVEVLPTSLRVGDEAVGAETPIMRQLAQRLHYHGVAQVHLDAGLDLQSLQRFCELIAGERDALDAGGGIDWVIEHEQLNGVRVERLQLERLFDEHTGAEGEDPVWDALVRSYRAAGASEATDWLQLSSAPEQLKPLIDWVLRHAAELERLVPGHSQADVLGCLCRRLDGLAPAVRSDTLTFLALAVREAFDQIDPEAIVKVMSESLGEPEAAYDGRPGEDQPASGPPPEPSPDGADRGLDLTGLLAQGLEGPQIERLILHALGSRRSSPRLYGVLSRLVEGRADRGQIVRQVRAAVEEAVASEGVEETILHQWPKLNEVLSGEAPDRFMSAAYSATLTTLAARGGMAEAWPLERIRPRLAEMDPYRLLTRKCRVLLLVLDHLSIGEDYATVATELEQAIPEFLRRGDHDIAEQILALVVRHQAADAARSEADREAAAAIVTRFFDERNLRQHLRDALARPQQEVETFVRLMRLAGPTAVPVLLMVLADEPSRRIRERLLRVIVAMGDDALDEISRRLGDDRWYVLRNLVLIVGEIGDRKRAPKMDTAIRHEDVRVRAEAVRTLIKVGGAEAARLLTEGLADADEQVRLAAIHGLGYCAVREAVPKVFGLLQLPNWRGQNTTIVQTAAIAAGRLRAMEAEPVLARLAERPWIFAKAREPVREAARWAMRALKGGAAGPAPDLPALARLRPGEKQLVSAT